MEKIQQADLVGKGVIGLPDTPGLTAAEMQAKFEETAREVIVPKFNALVDELSGAGAASVGAVGPDGEKTTVQAELDALHVNKIDAPATAKAGQALVVRSVDEHGFPTEWEAADVGQSLIVTVANDKASHTAEEIAAHVQAGGTAVLMVGNEAGNFIAYNEDDGTAVFFLLYMDAIWSYTIDRSGNVDKYVLYEDANYVKTVNGIAPDENGEVTLVGGGAGLIVTVANGKASHTAAEIAAHVQAGGTVVLKWSDGSVYGFDSYDASENEAVFVETVWTGDIKAVTVNSGGTVKEILDYNPDHFVKKVNGIEPDENGNVEISGGGLAFSKDILPETHFTAENGAGYEWTEVEGLVIKLEAPIVAGKTYTVTVDGVSYEGMAVADTEDYTPDFVSIELGDDVGVGVSYSPIYYAENYGDYNASVVDWDNWELNKDDEFIPQSATVSITQKGATPGDVVVVKSVDENGNPTEFEGSDLLLPGRDVFPETHFETKDGDGWNWDGVSQFFFNLPEALIEGQTYTVTIDGNTCAVTAVKGEDIEGLETNIYMEISGIGHVGYYGSDADYPGYNAYFAPNYWEVQAGETDWYYFQPFTIGIKTQKYVNPKYIDIALLKAALGL